MLRPRPDPREIKRVLIVKLSSIGDVVHALPVSAALGDAFPHWDLTWIVEERAAPVVQGNRYLHDVLVLAGDWYKRPLAPATWRRFLALRRELRARRFDLAIDLQGLGRSALIVWHSGARFRFGYNYLREGAHLVMQRIPRAPASVHIVDQLLDVPRFLGAPVAEVRFPVHISLSEDAAAVHMLQDAQVDADRPFLAINPTDGGYGHKGLGVDRCAALIKALQTDPNLPVVLVGGVEDCAIGTAIESQLRRRPANLIGHTNLKQLAAILQRAALHVAGDTGSLHLAAALGTPVVAVFGRTNPDRLAPYGQRAYVLQHREECAEPCRRHHQRAPINCDQTCFALPPRCLGAVSVAEICTAVRRHLYGRTPSAPEAMILPAHGG